MGASVTGVLPVNHRVFSRRRFVPPSPPVAERKGRFALAREGVQELAVRRLIIVAALVLVALGFPYVMPFFY